MAASAVRVMPDSNVWFDWYKGKTTSANHRRIEALIDANGRLIEANGCQIETNSQDIRMIITVFERWWGDIRAEYDPSPSGRSDDWEPLPDEE